MEQQYHIDAATAKLREENEQLKREQQVLLDIHAALRIKWGDDPYAVIRELKQWKQRVLRDDAQALRKSGLAHQQPSEQIKIHACDYCGNFHDPDYSDCATGEPILQASAPTPVVEKIARECCQDIEGRTDDCDMAMHAKIMRAIAQARAPLVAAVRFIQFQAECWSNTGDSQSLREAMKQFGKVARAALTGTGEKQ